MLREAGRPPPPRRSHLRMGVTRVAVAFRRMGHGATAITKRNGDSTDTHNTGDGQ